MGLALHVCLGLLSIQIIKSTAVNFLGLESGMLRLMLVADHGSGAIIDISSDGQGYIYQRRIRRYVFTGFRIPAYHLTWTLMNTTIPYVDTALVQIRAAFDFWQSGGIPLTFEEVKSRSADIKIYFFSGAHSSEAYREFGTNRGTLGHVMPNVHDEIHINYDKKFSFLKRIGKGTTYNLTVLVAHELGHVLGLLHSNAKKSVMAKWHEDIYMGNRLQDDDAKGVRALYGKVNPCKAKKYDAISVLDNDIVIFIGRFFWRKSKIMYPKKMQNEYDNFPRSIRNIDAFHIDSEGNHIFFSGKLYYVFKKKILQPDNPKKLTELGLPKRLNHINAILLMNDTKHPFVISDNDYWILDSKSLLVIGNGTFNDWPGYPGPINTGFRYIDGRTYVFRKNSVWVVDGGTFVKLKEAKEMTASDWVCKIAIRLPPISITKQSLNHQSDIVLCFVIIITCVMLWCYIRYYKPDQTANQIISKNRIFGIHQIHKPV